MSRLMLSATTLVVGLLIVACTWQVRGQETSAKPETAAPDAAVFQDQVQPVLQKYCHKCHNADEMMSGIRVDHLTADPEDGQLPLLKGMLQQIADGDMPPAEARQPSDAERKTLTDWLSQTLQAARLRKKPLNGSVRRLTIAQYRNTLKDLLLLEEDLTEILPPDGTSKDGFANNSHTLLLSPLLVENYFDIAEKALDLCIVDEKQRPVVQNFRMDLGAGINPEPCPDQLILGANSFLLNNADFVVTELQPQKPFDYQPFAMQKTYEFIEGYAGNDTVRGWRKFDSIYHSVFACMRGTPGYPKGDAFNPVRRGLLLRPSIPSEEIFGQSNTYGPMANFKISLRELPEQGNFRVTVKAARYQDGLLLDAGATSLQTDAAITIPVSTPDQPVTTEIDIPEAGIYQVAASAIPGKNPGQFTLNLGDREFAGRLLETKRQTDEAPTDTAVVTPFLLVRLPAGKLPLSAKHQEQARLKNILLSPVPADADQAQRFIAFEKRNPSLGVYVGLRRDCGSTLTPAGSPQAVTDSDVHEFVFTGAINDFPSPDVEKDNVNYLAGVREIGVRSEYTDGRDMPRLLIKSIEFEGPFYETWPPATHQNIFLPSPQRENPAAYAREIIHSFATRAFRRPVTPDEENTIYHVWESSFAASGDFTRSIKDALLIVLTSPQFLFLIENSSTPDAEDLDPFELASKLSYFLWNTAPDQRLLDLAASNSLHAALDTEFDRMLHDPRFQHFVHEFGTQWLSLDKFDVLAIDAQRYPRLTRDTRAQLRLEPIHYLHYLIDQNLPVKNLVQSDFVVANEVVASYYGLGNRTESGLRFVSIPHENPHLGGVLTQAAILAGLSDGRESNPVKRGAWLARKMIAMPPDDPPPNVPQLKDDDGEKLTLRQKLERHRNQPGCAKCHSGIDPWGVPFESYDASGLWKTAENVDASSVLPDGTAVANLQDLQAYLADDLLDQVAFNFLKHASSYAIGRTLTYNEIAFLQEQGVKLKPQDYRLQELLRFIIHSDMFLKK